MKIGMTVTSNVEFGELMPAGDLLKVGTALANQVGRRTKGGIGSDGQPLKTSLRKSGRMLSSVHAEPEGQSVVIVSDAPYAAAVDQHHPWMGVAPQDEAALDAAIDEAVTAALGGK